MKAGDKVRILTWTIFGDTGTVITIRKPSALLRDYPVTVRTAKGHEVGYYPEELEVTDLKEMI